MEKTGRILRHYSREFKLQVVEESLFGKESKYSICKKYGISSPTLYSWISIFAPDHTSEKLMKKEPESAEITRLKQALQQKELELARSKMETAVYRELVAIAKEDYGLDLSKKAGTKQ